MAVPVANLSEDDWQHIDDDDYSVVSLPTSEIDLINTTRCEAESVLTNASNHAAVPHTSPDAGQNDHTQDDTHTDEEYEGVEKYGMDKADVVETHDSLSPLKKILDSKPNPSFLSDLADSLRELVEDIILAITSLGQRHGPIDCVMKIQSECRALLVNLKQLESILKSYRQSWTPEDQNTLPIDPGLTTWMSRLKLELVSLQTKIKSTDPDRPLSLVSTWVLRMEAYLEALTTFSSQLKVFLPYSDLAEFYTAGMPVLSASDDHGTASSSSRAPTRHNTNLPPGNNLAHLRRELYALKDQIWSYIREVESYTELGFSHPPEASRTLCFQHIKRSLDVMLSNHASDWIDYNISGGLITYPEFCQLNPDTIRSLILQLKEATDDVMLARSAASSYRYFNDPDDRLENCGDQFAVKQSTWDVVATIEELLRSILRIRNDQDSSTSQ
ncbi:hypothetical protein F5Y16DRAFT_423535 [Xylariaceae sp. FL0255]|nr:hypothetical protein F5Y16DRAFT_423535 [Xylariaceae sp. FL0255]